MAYAGTTAASSLANPPIQLVRALASGGNTSGGTSAGLAAATAGGVGGGLWLYYSTNSSTEMYAANFFSDAFYLGMKQGDVVICAGATGSSALLSMHTVAAVTTAGAALSSAGGITSTFN
jgi:hypothetical protein